MAGPYKVGLTGGIGSGKTLVSNMFSGLGVPVIDADEISRNLTLNDPDIQASLLDYFGPEITGNDTRIDRKRLKELVFSDDNRRKQLEEIIHPRVYDIIRDKIRHIQAPYCILSVPLLVETGQTGMVDAVLVVDCPVSLQIARVKQRDGLAAEEINRIIASQASRQARLDMANDVIVNDGDEDKVLQNVIRLDKKYTTLANRTGATGKLS